MQDFEPTPYQDQLLRGLTHKMNNILSLFHGYLGMLMEDKENNADTLSGLARIQEGAFSASALMDRTQALIRPNSIILRELDLSEFALNSKRGLDSLISRGIRIEIAAEENSALIMSDMARLRAILSEIVSNAIEASPDNETVLIETAIEPPRLGDEGDIERPNAMAVISVRNKGNEMSPDAIKRAFEPFFTTRQKRGAFGLGLTIALGMAKQIGASIHFERFDAETVFQVIIPLKADTV